MFAGPWHGSPPFPLHSRAMVTCSGLFLYSRGRLSSSSCSIATCWASRATAILTPRWSAFRISYAALHMCVTVHVFLSMCLYLAWSCRMLRSCRNSSTAALESVRQAAGTSATGIFSCCSSGAGRGTGCFCRLDMIRSLAAHRGHYHTIEKLTERFKF